LSHCNAVSTGVRWPFVVGAVILLAPWGCSSLPQRAQAPPPVPGPQSAPNPQSLVGEWVGPTEEDGTLTLVLAANGRVNYRFSGGKKEHGEGRYVVRGNALVVTEDGDDDDEAESWSFSLAQGQLHLRMPDDDEVFVLMRRN